MQNQEATDLRAGQQRVHAQVGVDLFHAFLDQLVDLRLLRQIGVAGVRQVAALGPVADGVEVDVDHDADFFTSVAIGHHFLDVREELEFVLDVLGCKHGTVVGAALDAAHVFDAVNDLEVAVGVQEAGIAGVVPAVGAQHFGSGCRILEVFLEQPW